MSTSPPLNKSEMARLYRRMMLIRSFEEASSRQYARGKIRGLLHLYVGQEAIAAGAASALNDGDYVFSHHRSHGHALARGMEPKAVMAELCGKATGSSGGRSGSTGLFDASLGFVAYGTAGGHLPIATGMALSCKLKAEGRAVLCFFEDDAVNQGIFHESLNLASLWDLPILFFLENNLYEADGCADTRRGGDTDLYRLADAYHMPGGQIDGMDPVAVRSAAKFALEKARGGAGPVLIEAPIFRPGGRSAGDPSGDGEPPEPDPLEGFRVRVIEQGAATEEELEAIDADAASEIEEAVRFAEESPDPDAATLSDHVYA